VRLMNDAAVVGAGDVERAREIGGSQGTSPLLSLGCW
jgi:hypothetical protein